jgi:hypothetical protein
LVVAPPTPTTIPPGDEVTVYAVRTLPLPSAAVQLTAAVLFPAVAMTEVGAVGVPTTMLLEGAEAGPVPAAFVAVTVKVYAVPLVSPITMALLALPPALAVTAPGEDVTV